MDFVENRNKFLFEGKMYLTIETMEKIQKDSSHWFFSQNLERDIAFNEETRDLIQQRFGNLLIKLGSNATLESRGQRSREK